MLNTNQIITSILGQDRNILSFFFTLKVLLSEIKMFNMP